MSNPRLVAAGLIAALGLAFAGRALWRAYSRERRPAAEVLPAPADSVAQRTLSAVRTHMVPTAAGVDGVCQSLASGAEDLARPLGLAPAMLQDLRDAVNERLLASLSPDFARDWRAMAARGARVDIDSVSEGDRQAWLRSHDNTAMAPIDPDGVEVRWVFRGGVRVAPPAGGDGGEGFAANTFTVMGPPRMDIPENAEEHHLDVIEVRVPIAVLDRGASERATALVGYQFGWNRERRRWIPFANVVYGLVPHDCAPF